MVVSRWLFANDERQATNDGLKILAEG